MCNPLHIEEIKNRFNNYIYMKPVTHYNKALTFVCQSFNSNM